MFISFLDLPPLPPKIKIQRQQEINHFDTPGKVVYKPIVKYDRLNKPKKFTKAVPPPIDFDNLGKVSKI